MVDDDKYEVAEAVAKIDDVYYATLADAIAAVEDGETIELLADTEIEYMTGYKTYTLDLGEFELEAEFVDIDGGNVTIQNGTVTGNGYFMYVYGCSDSAKSAGAYSKLVIGDDVVVNGDVVLWGCYGADAKGYGAQIDVNGSVNGCVFVSGNITEGNSVVNIRGDVYSTRQDIGVAVNGKATVNVFDGAEIEAKNAEGKGTGIEVRAGSLNVEGGTITGNGVPTTVTPNGNGTTSTGAAIAVAQHTTQLPINVSISGGTFKGYTAFYESNPQNNGAAAIANVNLSITGGSFQSTEGGTKAVYSEDKQNFVNGGFFSDNGVYVDGYCVDTYYAETITGAALPYQVIQCTEHVDVNPADGRCDICGHRLASFVTVTSSGSGTPTAGSPVAFVSGGGIYETGASVTVSAPELSGYSFLGWYVVGGSKQSSSLDYTFTADGQSDYNLIAVYSTGASFRLTVTGSKFKIDNGTTQRSWFDDYFEAGSSITIEFVGSENFLYWVNASNKVVSRSKSFTYNLATDSSFTAVYSDTKAGSNEALVVFVSAGSYGQVISSRYYSSDESIVFPAPPSSMGKTFVGWSMTEDQIQAAMSSQTRIEVYPVYEQTSGNYTVTVHYVDSNGSSLKADEVKPAVAVGTTQELIADATLSGMNFSYWTDSLVNGNVLSYSTSYYVRPTTDIDVYAVYGAAESAVPTIAMTDAYASMNGAKYRVSFTTSYDVPDGYTFTEAGIIYANTTKMTDRSEEMVLNSTNPDVKYYISTITANSGVVTLNVSFNKSTTDYSARGYVTVRDADGKLVTFYAENILNGSYDTLRKIDAE